MGDVITKLGIEYGDRPARQLISDMQEARTATTQVTEAGRQMATEWSDLAQVITEVQSGQKTASEGLAQLNHEGIQTAQSFKELKSQLAEIGITSTKLRPSTEETAQSLRSAANESRQLGMAFYALTIAGFGLMSVERELESAYGEELPEAFKSTVNSLNMIASFGSAGAMLGGPVGALLGGLTGAVIGFGTALTAIDPDIKELNQELDNLANKGKTADTLAEIMGWTRLDAQWALEAAKNNEALAEALDKVAKDREPPTIIDILTGARAPFRTSNYFDATKGRTLAEDEQNLQLQLQSALYQQLREDGKRYYDDISQAAEQLSDLQQEQSERMVEFAEREAEAFENAAEARIRAEQRAADQTERINRQLADALEQAAQQLASRRADIDREYADKEADLAWQRDRRLEEFAADEARRRQQLADTLADITRSEQQSLAALDFNTHEQLLDAKTQREREDILRRYQFEKGQIEQRANDQRTDAEERFAEEQALAAERRRLMEEEFEHQRALNVRETQERIADAQEAYEAQVAAAHKRNEEQLADLQKSLAAEKLAIQERYEDEIKQIGKARSAFSAAQGERIAKLEEELSVLREIQTIWLQLNGLNENPIVGAAKKWALMGGGEGHQLGGIVGGPMGAPRPIIAHGGEEVIPVSRVGRTSQESAPQMVFISAEPLVAPAVQRIVEQMYQSNVFRESVMVLLNDEAFR